MKDHFVACHLHDEQVMSGADAVPVDEADPRIVGRLFYLEK